MWSKIEPKVKESNPYHTLNQSIFDLDWDEDQVERLNVLFLRTQNKVHTSKSWLRWFFTIGKKFADLLDDFWNAIRNFLPAAMKGVTPVLIGAVGSVLHLSETWDNIKLAYKAYKDKKIAQRKTKFSSGIVSILLGLTGLGFSGALFLDGINVGLGVAGSAFMPTLIPGLLTIIFAIKTGRFAYALKETKKDEQLAKVLLNEAITQSAGIENETVKAAEERYHFFHEQRLQAERKVAFAVLETTASFLVTVGVLLGTAAIVGLAAVGTFGILPTAVILTAVTIAVSAKIFECVDEKFHHTITRKIKSWFKNDDEYKPILKPPHEETFLPNLKLVTQDIEETNNRKPPSPPPPSAPIVLDYPKKAQEKTSLAFLNKEVNLEKSFYRKVKSGIHHFQPKQSEKLMEEPVNYKNSPVMVGGT